MIKWKQWSPVPITSITFISLLVLVILYIVSDRMSRSVLIMDAVGTSRAYANLLAETLDLSGRAHNGQSTAWSPSLMAQTSKGHSRTTPGTKSEINLKTQASGAGIPGIQSAQTAVVSDHTNAPRQLPSQTPRAQESNSASLTNVLGYSIVGKNGNIDFAHLAQHDPADRIKPGSTLHNLYLAALATKASTHLITLDLGILGGLHICVAVPLIKDGVIENVVLTRIKQGTAGISLFMAIKTMALLTVFMIIAGFAIALVVVILRVRDRRKARKDIRYLAFHDQITGRLNRAAFTKDLDNKLQDVAQQRKRLAVICIDIDRYKETVDTMGHRVGDALLRAVAERINGALKPIDTIARLTSDEFAIILRRVHSHDDVTTQVLAIIDQASGAYLIEGNEIICKLSVGIALAPLHGKTSEELIKNADLALYNVADDAQIRFRYFHPHMTTMANEQRNKESALRRAVANNSFELYYQPQFSLAEYRLTGFEALIRWRDPDKGLIAPDDFIELAERTGLIRDIGEIVLQQACQEAASWNVPYRIAINLSPVQFTTWDVVGKVRDALEMSGLAPERLEIEITENVLLDNTNEVLAILAQLRRMRVVITMDDFGTGYSSLRYLTAFPFDKFKIDRSFITNFRNDRNMAAIVNTMIALGKALHVKINAEGVETKEQAELLRLAGCDEAQGLYYGAPAPAPEMLFSAEAFAARAGHAA